jgi:hypothetical protein
MDAFLAEKSYDVLNKMPKTITLTFHPSTPDDIKWKQIYYVSLVFKRVFRNYEVRIAEDVINPKSNKISTLVLDITMTTSQYDNFYKTKVKPHVAKEDWDEEFEEPKEHVSTYLQYIFDEINVKGASIDISIKQKNVIM